MCVTITNGELAEWSNAAVLKTVVPQGTRGSNPLLSAIMVLTKTTSLLKFSNFNGDLRISIIINFIYFEDWMYLKSRPDKIGWNSCKDFINSSECVFK